MPTLQLFQIFQIFKKLKNFQHIARYSFSTVMHKRSNTIKKFYKIILLFALTYYKTVNKNSFTWKAYTYFRMIKTDKKTLPSVLTNHLTITGHLLTAHCLKVLCGKVCWKFASWKIFVPSGDLFCFPHRDSWLNATTLLDAQISIIFMHCFMKQEKEEGGGGGWEKAHFQYLSKS
ncbi:hypothetical protein T4B_9674 [Trichinella pseudospiralis]|uniref:Uncharacterized protein n=1 Tax=Trichinella pseudospiralis TaxID=6337 RepID=A0A0V1IWP0_TRIPS|nr:hypothetical protein T4B_9674 [Trichinella pseudospiralis]